MDLLIKILMIFRIYQKFFINSKSDGEKFLVQNYPNNKLCIIRPSNIYGFNCKPDTK